jgi:PAS domain S-box-containing protein
VGLVLVAGAFSALFFVWLLVKVGGERLTEDVDDLGTLIAALAAALACMHAARSEVSQIRRGWYLLGFAALSWAIGDAIWCYHDLLLGAQMPFPSPADAGYLLAVPLSLAGLLAFFSPPVGLTSRLRAVVDALIVGSALLLISWLTVLEPVYNAGTGNVLAQAISLAYPVGDVVILSTVVIVAGRSRSAERLPYVPIGLAMAALAISDSAFAYLTQKGGYGASQIVDTGWVVGYLILALAAIKPRASEPSRKRTSERTLLPYVPVLAAIVLVAARTLSGDAPDAFGRWALLAMFLFVVVRQLLTLRENRSLTRELEHSEQRLASLIEHSTDVVTVLDEDLRIRWQAQSIGAVLGFEASDWLATQFTEHVHADDRGALEHFLAQARSRPGPSGTLELRLRDADGQVRWFEIAASNRLHDPSVRGFVLSIRDTTDRRRLESERAKTTQLTQRVAAERDQRELQARLLTAHRLESIGALAGGVAHDFNNLLAVILDYVGFIREDLPPGSESRADIDQIANAAQRGMRLTEQLLAFRRRKIGDIQTLDVGGVIAGMQTMLDRPLGSHIELRYQRAANLWPVRADPSDIEQIVLNLVVNARDALTAGGHITVCAQNIELAETQATELHVSPGGYVRISVADDGCGIEPDTLEHVWEPLFTTKPADQGTGLGLATVQRIARHAHGAATITSTPGSGTQVKVYLPGTRAHAGPPASPSPQPLICSPRSQPKPIKAIANANGGTPTL